VSKDRVIPSWWPVRNGPYIAENIQLECSKLIYHFSYIIKEWKKNHEIRAKAICKEEA
jgi:hypothetical protein